jgi:hypothetical protein
MPQSPVLPHILPTLYNSGWIGGSCGTATPSCAPAAPVGEGLSPSRRCVLAQMKAVQDGFGSIDPVYPQADKLVDGQILHPARTQVRDEFRGYAMNPHGHELVRFRMAIPQPLQLLDEVR